MRNDRIGAHRHYSTCKATIEKWCTHTPRSIREQDVPVLSNEDVHTHRDRYNHYKRQDKRCIMINVAILADRNVIQNKAEKIKYKS